MKNKKEKKKKNITNYVYSETFKTNLENPTEEDLIRIFNEKFFKTIIKIEKSTSGGCNVWESAL